MFQHKKSHTKTIWLWGGLATTCLFQLPAFAGQWSSSVVDTELTIRNFFDGETTDSGAVDTGLSSIDANTYGVQGFRWFDVSSLFGYPLEPNGMGHGTLSKPYGCFMKGKLRLIYTPSTHEIVEDLPKKIGVKTSALLEFMAWGDLGSLTTEHKFSVVTDVASGSKFTVPLQTTSEGEVLTYSVEGTGKHLLLVNTQGGFWENGRYTVDYPIEVKSSYITTPGSGTNTDNWDSYFDIRVDNRAVVLSRGVGDKEETRYTNGVPITYGDTIFSYQEEYQYDTSRNGDPKYDKRPYYVRPLFNAGFSGDWSSEYDRIQRPDGSYFWLGVDWQWHPSDEHDLREYHRQEMPTGNFFKTHDGKWAGRPTPKGQKKIISYEATDRADGVTARAKYNLSLRDPEEWDEQPFRTDPPLWDFFAPTNSTKDSYSYDESISIDVQYDKFYFGAIKDGTKGFVSMWGEAHPLLALGAIALNLGLDLSPNPAKNIESKFSSLWNYTFEHPQANCTWVGGSKPVDENGDVLIDSEIMSQWVLKDPQWAVEYEDKWFKGKSYDESGYKGELQQIIRVQTLDSRAHIVGTFEPGQGTGAPPVDPDPENPFDPDPQISSNPNSGSGGHA